MTTEREEWTVNGVWHVVNAHGGLVADVYGSAENVRRIAAVPDMEAALKECVRELRRMHERYIPSYDGPEGEPSKAVIGAGTAALRKAGLIP